MPDVDHLVYGAPDLEPAVLALQARLGVRAAEGGCHPRWGTRNALLSLGDRTYLEIIAPDPERERPETPTLFGLDRLEGPRLVAWAAPASDLDARLEAAARAGVALGGILPGSRETPDGTVLTWRLTDPEVVVGDRLVPFLIDWGETRHPARAAPPAGTLVTLRGEHPDPGRVRALLDAVGIRLDVVRAAEPGLVAAIRTAAGEIVLR